MNVIPNSVQAECALPIGVDRPQTAACGPGTERIRNVIQCFHATNRSDRGWILLVDDNQSVRETLADVLEVAGFCVGQANDATEALRLLRQGHAFDAIVTDFSMPGDDGITLIQQARAIRPELPAVLMTGYAEQVTAPHAAFHVLRKPFATERLIAHLDQLVRMSVAG